MKVIKDNCAKSQFTYPFRVTCSICKSVLEVSKSDVKKSMNSDPRDSSAPLSYSIICILCKAHTPVKPKVTRKA